MGGIGGPELFLVLLVVLVVFGPRKIPEIARGLGRGMREFRRLSTEFQRELNIADALEGKKDVWGPGRTKPPGASSTPSFDPLRRPQTGPPGEEPPGTGAPPAGSPPAE